MHLVNDIYNRVLTFNIYVMSYQKQNIHGFGSSLDKPFTCYSFNVNYQADVGFDNDDTWYSNWYYQWWFVTPLRLIWA